MPMQLPLPIASSQLSTAVAAPRPGRSLVDHHVMQGIYIRDGVVVLARGTTVPDGYVL